MHSTDTIAAISSPPGEGGIGVIRMSGPHAHSILKNIFRPKTAAKTLVSHRLYLGHVFDPETGADVDEVFAVAMAEPSTYTREEMAEVYCHGGLAAQRRTLEIMIGHGARIAEPGEFTKRAYLNGRIDLAQAESVLDIIESQTDQELQAALSQIKGQLTVRIRALRDRIMGILAEVEADIDFPDEDLAMDRPGWSSRCESARSDLSSLVASYYEGRAITQGLDVLIVGKTNVGKSSLLNALVQSDKAIVTHLPGTTRDLVEDMIVVKGVKLRVTDTAGLRHSNDPVERIGIHKTRERIPNSDIVLWVLDASTPYTVEDEQAYGELTGRRVVAVLNKIDLPRRMDAMIPTSLGVEHTREVSALAGDGIEELKTALYDISMSPLSSLRSNVVVTNVRHRDLLTKTAAAVERARDSIASTAPLEIIAFELRDALTHLGDITGETCPEEVLNEIFSRFCIGK